MGHLLKLRKRKLGFNRLQLLLQERRSPLQRTSIQLRQYSVPGWIYHWSGTLEHRLDIRRTTGLVYWHAIHLGHSMFSPICRQEPPNCHGFAVCHGHGWIQHLCGYAFDLWFMVYARRDWKACCAFHILCTNRKHVSTVRRLTDSLADNLNSLSGFIQAGLYEVGILLLLSIYWWLTYLAHEWQIRFERVAVAIHCRLSCHVTRDCLRLVFLSRFPP